MNNETTLTEELLNAYIDLFEKSLELNRVMLKELTSYRRAFPEYIPDINAEEIKEA